jgi:hypothetical protein
MPVQTVNTYAFCVKRLSGISSSGVQNGQYEGEQVYVVATSLANAQATLAANYGSDLGPVTGGAAKTPGAITQLA